MGDKVVDVYDSRKNEQGLRRPREFSEFIETLIGDRYLGVAFTSPNPRVLRSRVTSAYLEYHLLLGLPNRSHFTVRVGGDEVSVDAEEKFLKESLAVFAT